MKSTIKYALRTPRGFFAFSAFGSAKGARTLEQADLFDSISVVLEEVAQAGGKALTDRCDGQIVRVELRETPAGREEAPLEDPRPGAKYALKYAPQEGDKLGPRYFISDTDTFGVIDSLAQAKLFDTIPDAIHGRAVQACLRQQRRGISPANRYDLVKVYETPAGTTRVLGEVVS
jgi:hypothetical protein